MNTVTRFGKAAVALWMVAGVAAAEGTPVGKSALQDGSQGLFTGQYIDGRPVYRFPTIVVTASRRAELARIEEAGKNSQTKQARAKANPDYPSQGARVATAMPRQP